MNYADMYHFLLSKVCADSNLLRTQVGMLMRMPHFSGSMKNRTA